MHERQVFQANPTGKTLDYRAQQITEGRALTGDRWTRWRRRWLVQHPSCAMCGLAGEEVHHIVPRAEAPERTFDWSNFQTLCRKCHKDIHLRTTR